MKTGSLKGSLQWAVALSILLVGLVISLLVTRQYSQALMENTQEKAQNMAHKLAMDAADLILINDLVALHKLIDSLQASTPGIGYIFIEKDGRVLVHSFADGFPVGLIGINRPEAADRGRLANIIAEDRQRYLDVAWPIFDGHAGILRLGLSESVVRDQVRAWWLRVSLASGLVLAAALVIVRFLIVYLMKPLSDLTEQVARIDEAKLDDRIVVSGRREVNRLTAAFNHLLDRIDDYTQRLSKTNRDLTAKHEALARAHRQLESSFTISREIAGLSDLQDICGYLFGTFRRILSCRQMGFLLFSPSRRLRLLSDQERREYDGHTYDQVQTLIGLETTYRFIETDAMADLSLPRPLATAARLAVFPFHHQGEPAGVLIIGCQRQCTCHTHELAVIGPILSQSSNAIRRSLMLEEDLARMGRSVERQRAFYGLIGKDPKMQAIFRLIENVATTETSVLIQGESGTGKELVAQAIHDCSPRKNQPFVVINCSAYPATLLESELFGHEKGAFTGATRRKAGRFEQADGGTVFLDEIGEISASAQIKLLRVLQSRKFERLGAEATLTIDVRILAATNKNLARAVQVGEFREDLFYRLNVIPIYLPSLKERHHDIILLARHFLQRFASEQQKTIDEFSADAMRLLTEYDWPGNVRELENAIEHAVVMAKGDGIDVLDLPAGLHRQTNDHPSAARTLSQTETELIRDVLQVCDGNKSKAAATIGISRGTLYQKMRKYGL